MELRSSQLPLFRIDSFFDFAHLIDLAFSLLLASPISFALALALALDLAVALLSSLSSVLSSARTKKSSSALAAADALVSGFLSCDSLLSYHLREAPTYTTAPAAAAAAAAAKK